MEPIDLTNEFAAVRLAIDVQGSGARLKITDLSSGRTGFLDPLELQSLTWARHEDIAALVRPEYREEILDAAVRESDASLSNDRPDHDKGV